MIKSSPSGGLLSEQWLSAGAVRQCIKIFVFHFTEHCRLFSLFLTWFSCMRTENFRMSFICKCRDPSFGTCELTWGCSLCHSSDRGLSRNYLLPRASYFQQLFITVDFSLYIGSLYLLFNPLCSMKSTIHCH